MSLPVDHPGVKAHVSNYIKARSNRGGVKANITSTWPCDPITAIRADHNVRILLNPEVDPSSSPSSRRPPTVGSVRRPKPKLMPAGYDGDPSPDVYPKVAVAPVPMCPIVPPPNMYLTTQESSLSSVYATPSLPYSRGSKAQSSVDVLLSRRETLKDEVSALAASIALRKRTQPPVRMVVPPDLTFSPTQARPSTALGFTATSYELTCPSASYSLRNARTVTRPISVSGHRKMVGTRVNAGGGFKWSMAYKTTNQMTNDRVYAKVLGAEGRR